LAFASSVFCFFYFSFRVLPSFPTRRSSDLVLLLADGAIGVVFVGRQLVPIIPNFLGEVKDGVGILCHLTSNVNLLDLIAILVVGHGEQGAAAGRLADQTVHFVVLISVTHPVRDGALQQAIRCVFLEIDRGTVFRFLEQGSAVEVIAHLHRPAVAVGAGDQAVFAVVEVGFPFTGGVHNGTDLSGHIVLILG